MLPFLGTFILEKYRGKLVPKKSRYEQNISSVRSKTPRSVKATEKLYVPRPETAEIVANGSNPALGYVSSAAKASTVCFCEAETVTGKLGSAKKNPHPQSVPLPLHYILVISKTNHAAAVQDI